MTQETLLILLAVTTLAWQTGGAAARDLPKLDVNRTCRAEAPDRNKTMLDACMADEQKAQEQLTKQWNQFAPGIQQTCVATATDIKGIGSYVELLTCLEMATEAKKLPKE